MQLVYDFAVLKVNPRQEARQQQGKSRRHVADGAATLDKGILHEGTVKQLASHVCQDPRWYRVTLNQLRHLLPVEARVDCLRLDAPSDFALQAAPGRLGHRAVLGEGINHLVFPLNILLDLVIAGDNGDDPADNEAVHHRPDDHGDGHCDDFSLCDRRDVTETNRREDREDEVHGDEPLLKGCLAQERRPTLVNLASPDPCLLDVFVHGGAEVPEAREEVQRPYERGDEGYHADSA
mmetsp:Transcript_14356/g.42728  ORF Transcript_14356/g.42728 Transcript_14356/m.42728 type:complete len:236 (+) Transcript_14356:1207-1914(+)